MPYRVVLQEGRRQEDLFEFYVNAVRHVLFGESEEVIHQLHGSHDRGFDWVDELKKDLEGFCGLHDLNGGEGDVSRSGLGWLRESEHIMEDG